MAEPAFPPRPFTPETLAERWDCSPEHVRTLCKQGRLRSFKIGRGLYRVPPDAVTEYEARAWNSGSTEDGGTPTGKKGQKRDDAPFVPRIVMPL